MKQSVVWLNGEMLPAEQAGVPLWDLGLVAGAAVSEMARTYRGRPFRLRSHIDRLTASCEELKFPLRWSESELEESALAMIEANRLHVPAGRDAGIVFFVTAGANATYLPEPPPEEGTTAIHSFPLPLERWQDAVRDGIRLTLIETMPHAADVLPVHLKVRNRLHWMLADREAERQRPGTRALLCDTAGMITETATSAFFAVINGTVRTADHHVLSSMSAAVTADVCRRIGIPYAAQGFTRDELHNASEAFVTSTPCGLLPVQSVDAVRFPVCGTPSSTAARIVEGWEGLTGVNTWKQICEH